MPRPSEQTDSFPVSAVHILTHEFMPFRGGIGVYVEETAGAMARAGLTTTVWAPDYGEPFRDDGSYAVRRVPMRGKQDWLCRAQLAKALKASFRHNRIPGMVILAEPGPLRLWMYHRFLRLPRPDQLVVVLHGSEVRALTQMTHRKVLLRRLLRDAHRIGVVSRAVERMVLEHFPEIRKKIRLVPGAVRHKWQGLPPESGKNHLPVWHILQVGRVSPRKGQLELVQAIAGLPVHLRNQIRVRLVGPIGNQGYADEVERRASELDVPVIMVGSLDDDALREAYEEADVVVMPSQPYLNSIEGLGIALLEGAHFGCPVVGTRLGGIPEALKEGETGILVGPEDVEGLSHALRQIFTQPESAYRMGQAGAAFVRERFCWDRNVRALMGLKDDP